MVDRLLSLEKKLRSELFDQDMAIDTIIQTLSQLRYLEKKRLFKALFTFIGPPNSGKHFLAQKLLEHDHALDDLKIFHMDWYTENEKINSIEQEIRAFITSHPNAILLFEEIEKAELQVQLTLFGLFNDTTDTALDLSQCVIIFTTSRATAFISQANFKALYLEDPLTAQTYLAERLSKEQMVLSGIAEQAFEPKLLSLMNQNSMVVFNKLTLSSLIKIGARALHEMSQNFLHQNISVEYIGFDKIASLLTLSLAPYLNAKHIKEKLPEQMFGHIYKSLKLDKDVLQVTCRVSKQAETFLTHALKDSGKLLKQLRDQHQRIVLKWEYRIEPKSIVCEIAHAEYAKQHIKTSHEEEFKASEITFNDIAGHSKVKKELLELVVLLKEPSRLLDFSMPLPKGFVLQGPPHVGKKMLARAFANEVDMPYIKLSQADLFDEKKIHTVYQQALTMAPSIVILEDIDIQGFMGGMLTPVPIAPYIAQLNALVQSHEPSVFTIATLSTMNAALEGLLESGYLDISIEVPKLDMQARRFFIEKVLKMPNDGKIDVDKVVRYISGMDGKELQKIANDSAIFAARKGLKQITQEILLEQINIIKYGTKLENRQMRDIERSMETTAYHEAGHAVLSHFLMPETKIEQVTVAPRNNALGFVSYNNEEYIDATSKEELFNNICVLLAGRASTEYKYGSFGIETGASNDLEVANLQVYAAIALFGMDEELQNLSISGVETAYTKELFSKKIEERMLIWLDQAKQKAQAEVKKHWHAIENVAQALIEKEVIDGMELKTIIKSHKKSVAKKKE